MNPALWRLIVELQTRGYCVSRIAWPHGGYAVSVVMSDRSPDDRNEESYGGSEDELRALRAIVERVEPALLEAEQ